MCVGGGGGGGGGEGRRLVMTLLSSINCANLLKLKRWYKTLDFIQTEERG